MPMRCLTVTGTSHHIQHGFDAICHQMRFCHQTCTECAPLHTFRRASTVQIDFVIAPLLRPISPLWPNQRVQNHPIAKPRDALQGGSPNGAVDRHTARHPWSPFLCRAMPDLTTIGESNGSAYRSNPIIGATLNGCGLQRGWLTGLNGIC
jgi:hypothetical protein